MIAMGVMGAMTAGIMTMNRNTQRTAKSVETSGEATQVMSQLLRAIVHSPSCSWTLQNQGSSVPMDLSGLPNNRFDLNGVSACSPRFTEATACSGTGLGAVRTIYQPGQVVSPPSGALSITRLSIIDNPLSTDAGDKLLEVEFQRDTTRSNGLETFVRTLPLFVVDDGGGNASLCYTDQQDLVEEAVRRSCQGNNAYWDTDTNQCFHIVENVTCAPDEVAVKIEAGSDYNPDPGNQGAGAPAETDPTSARTECQKVDLVIRKACNAVGTTGAGMVYLNGNEIYCKAINNCQPPKVLAWDSGTHSFSCEYLHQCGANQVAILKSNGSFVCRPKNVTCPGNNQYMFSVNLESSANPTCYPLVTNSQCNAEQGVKLVADANHAVKLECCNLNCDDKSNVCAGESFPSNPINGCAGICTGSNAGTKNIYHSCPSSDQLCTDGTSPNSGLPVESCSHRCPGLLTNMWDQEDSEFTPDQLCATAEEGEVFSRICRCKTPTGNCTGYRTITCHKVTILTGSPGSHVIPSGHYVVAGSVKVDAIGGGGGGAGGGRAKRGYAGKKGVRMPTWSPNLVAGSVCSWVVGNGGAKGKTSVACGGNQGGHGGATSIICDGVSRVAPGGARGGTCSTAFRNGESQNCSSLEPFYPNGGTKSHRNAENNCGTHESYGGSGAGGQDKNTDGNRTDGGKGRKGAIRIEYRYGVYGY